MVAMHIHRGAAGVGGPVVINSNLDEQSPSANGMLFRQVKITDPDKLKVIEEIMANPSNFYLNVHSTSRPNGLIRGQLQMDTASQLAELQKSVDAIEAIVRQVFNFPARDQSLNNQ